MYQFSPRLRNFSLFLMLLGGIGIGISILNTPKTVEQVEYILEKEAHEHGHHAHAETGHDAHHNHSEVEHKDTVAVSAEEIEVAAVDKKAIANDVAVKTDTVSYEAVAAALHNGHNHDHDDAHANEHQHHLEHVLHQMQNKPWAAFYVACIFFMLISVGVLAFYAIQYAAQAGWSPVLFRIMEGITGYLLPGSVIFFLLLILSGIHVNHLFVWMDPEVVAHDHLIQGKSGYLNVPFFLIRAFIFLLGWNLYRHYSRKNSIAQDTDSSTAIHKKNFKLAAKFLVFFIVSESMMSWDWIMSVDPHWYSTLFGWYVFASFFVSGITVITMITLYLQSKGYLPEVNKYHLHDLAKFMFAFSIFWTYLWFSQFMLIWYSNIPEEVTYFITRIEQYNLPFFGMLFLNFVFPILILVNADFKRVSWIVVIAGIIILFGHYIDFYNMIMPATVGDRWFIGLPEISAVAFFLGLFIFVVFTSLTKAPLIAKGNPLIEESKHFHY